MTNTCWENREHVERTTNMQLKRYLRQQSAKLSGNKALLIERVLNKHADGTFETKRHHGEDDESMPQKTEEEEEKISEGESSETSEDGYNEQSFEVMFIFDKDIAQVNK